VSKQLDVLIVDDSPEDAELVLRELSRGGYELRSRRVETRDALIDALATGEWDLVLYDYSLPAFDALSAVTAVSEHAPDLPVLVVSGTIGEERVAECMRAGAKDLVLKDRLARLVPAVEREVAEARRHADERRLTEELRRAEALLGRTEKLRLLGQMAAGISHDLKNLLNPLSLYMDLVDRALARGDIERARFGVGELKQVITLGVQTVDRLRVFSRPTLELKFVKLDLNQIAREAIALAQSRVGQTARRRVQIRAELGAPVEVLGEQSDLVSAVLNLLANSIDAMPDGGSVTVRTGEDAEQRWLEVSDDGPGMPPEVQERVFEPFFSTKGEQGTGLGLAMVQSAIVRHDGRVSLSSELGRGTTIRLSFSTEWAELSAVGRAPTRADLRNVEATHHVAHALREAAFDAAHQSPRAAALGHDADLGVRLGASEDVLHVGEQRAGHAAAHELHPSAAHAQHEQLGGAADRINQRQGDHHEQSESEQQIHDL
jgi:signal transduction histidine kinase